MDKPIRILNVVGKMDIGGTETLIMNIYRKIDRNKIQFDFMVHTEEHCTFDDEIISLGGRIYRLPQYNVKNHFTYKKKWNEFFKNHGEYKILHAHMTGPAAVFIPIAKKYGCYTIAHSHTAGAKGGVRQSVINAYQIPIRFETDYMMACSEEAAKWTFGKNALKRTNIRIIKNGIDTDRFTKSEEKRKEIRNEFDLENKFVMTYIARLHPMKNHLFLLDIFKEVLKRNDNSGLLIVGEGSEREHIQSRIRELGIEDKVILTGVRQDVDKILAAADVFCMTSLFEGLGIVLIEAQACDVKCICGDNIPQEANVTHSLTMLSLNELPAEWAKECLKYKDGYTNPNAKKLIKDSGYDINDTVRWLEYFYKEHRKGR